MFLSIETSVFNSKKNIVSYWRKCLIIKETFLLQKNFFFDSISKKLFPECDIRPYQNFIPLTKNSITCCSKKKTIQEHKNLITRQEKCLYKFQTVSIKFNLILEERGLASGHSGRWLKQTLLKQVHPWQDGGKKRERSTSSKLAKQKTRSETRDVGLRRGKRV